MGKLLFYFFSVSQLRIFDSWLLFIVELAEFGVNPFAIWCYACKQEDVFYICRVRERENKFVRSEEIFPVFLVFFVEVDVDIRPNSDSLAF